MIIKKKIFEYIDKNPETSPSELYQQFNDQPKGTVRAYSYEWKGLQTKKEINREMLDNLRFIYLILYKMIHNPDFNLSKKEQTKLKKIEKLLGFKSEKDILKFL